MKPINLRDHPEGGKFLPVFKSEVMVIKPDGQRRSALTHIYFYLAAGEVSRFHKVESDEVWNLYQGEGLYLYIWDELEDSLSRIEISVKNKVFCYVVAAGVWQAAEPIGDSVLVGCSVGPGFEFADFKIVDSESCLSQKLCDRDPTLLRFVGR
ncbi:cupin domain-containing protein [Microbulbifer sp. OS29]|uniref:Cupin domain-containing protein n=1 Tax=Microbulbifer okhotskensis TaxID=2926617 RepID=A0A9X2J5V3_9GAMM|nr:cupin domain-containing protein [Microbulbifer okhotskensis]MCO1335952.1 cupin domain-containing protein [Microbulbifer okhotskensis]